jgi:hypothetical protein
MVAVHGPAPEPPQHDARWYEALADDREIVRLAHDPTCARQRRMFGPVRVVAAVAFILGVVALVNVVAVFGLGAGLVAVWALPMLVLAVVLGAERLLVHFAK